MADARLESRMHRPVIRPVLDHEREDLYRFRYHIYVEEMNRKQKYADVIRRQIEDPLDHSAINMVAIHPDGSIVGAVRTNFARDSDLLGYEDFYEMTSAGAAHRTSTSICTRLMIAPQYRSSTLAARLSTAIYECGLRSGITHNFIDCNDHLVPFFRWHGFVQHVPKKMHEEYGQVTCMRLDLLDHAHLSSVRSPLLPSLNRWLAAHALGATEV